MRLSKLLLGTASSAVLISFASMAYAADANADADTSAAPTSVDEIVITATKREQSLQDVPIVVTAVSGQLMQDAGVHDIKDLTILTPGLTVTSTSNETITTARIRGVGTVGDNPGLESSVGVVVDGVYRPRNGVSFGDLGDVSRIEVLKGPQGTLFGKNTSAGVLNIITASPKFKFGGNAELTAGNYGAVGGSAEVTGPILGDTVAASLFFADRKRDGYLDVITGPGPRTQTDDVNQNFYTFRGQVLALPTDELSIRVIADYTKRDEDCCLATQLFVGGSAASRAALINATRPGSINTVANPFDRVAYGNRNTTQRIEDEGISAEINYRLGDFAKLTSITAARKWRAETGQDSDFTAADIAYRPDDGTNFNEFKQFSQELRANGTIGSVDWLVGGFYADETLNSRSVLKYGADYYGYFAQRVLGNQPANFGLVSGSIFQAGNGSDDSYHQKDKSFALFTDNTWAMTDSLKMTFGLRFTQDKKSLTTLYSTTGASCDQAEALYPAMLGAFTGALGTAAGAATAGKIAGGLCLNNENNDFDALGTFTQSKTERQMSGTWKLAYKFDENWMGYISASRGYKSGGFNLDRSGRTIVTSVDPITHVPTGLNFTANPNTGFGRELVDSYEIGFKSKLMDRSLLLNATLFHQTFTDFQLNTFVGTAFIVETIPTVVSKGIDADFVWFTPVHGLVLQGGVTYADTHYGRFTAADLTDPTRFASLSRLPGARLSFAPEISSSISGAYTREIGGNLEIRTNLAVKYQSTYNTGSDLHPSKQQEGFALVNGRIGLGSQDDKWTVELWGNNLFDKDYVQVGFNGPFQVDETNDAISVYDAFLGAPRTYGVTLRTKF
ncbi:MAG: TonB-dependent receptor [Caulobacter sp.]|nr:TonB-dependent receptor [Caulobacter sp.]